MFCFPKFLMASFNPAYSCAVPSATTFTRIAFSNIHSMFWRGRYGENEIIIRSADSFVNASKLRTYYGKDFAVWRELNHDLIQNVEQEMHDEHFIYQACVPKMEFKAVDTVLPVAPYDYDGVFIHPFL